jgi:NitT/TauT family transport system substrate-binding protein
VRRNSLLAALLSIALLLAACGDDDGDTATDGGTPSGGAGEPASDGDESQRGEGISFTVGFTGSEDIGHMNMLEALEQMEELGYEANAQYLAETELVTDSVVRGQFQVGIITTPVLVAHEQGATNLSIVGVRNPNDWAIVAQDGIESCDDLEGKRFAIHSEGSVMAAIYRQWASEACSEGVRPDEIVISGSDNRTAALMAGQIDATAVQIQDLATLRTQYADQYTVLSPQWRENPDLVSSGVYVNDEWAADNGQAVTDMLMFMTEIARDWTENPETYEEEIRERFPDKTDEEIQFFVEELTAAGLFATNGGITEEAMGTTIEFFTEAGTIEGSVTAEDVLDLTYLREALEELDVELSTQSEFLE